MTLPSTDSRIELDEQRRFWNDWNSQYRVGDRKMPEVNARQAKVVREWISGVGRADLDILEVGCGSGWLSQQLVRFGKVTATDLANEVLPPSQAASGGPTFIAGDFFALDLPRSAFDVVVSLEMLAHVEDQSAYVDKIAGLLRPGGFLMLATQNRFTLSRWSEVAPRGPGQIRKWVSAGELRALLEPRLRIQVLTSIHPVGDRGILRWVNGPMVNRVLSLVASQGRIHAMKERLLLGHTLMALARKPLPGRTA
jgi:2-polyprenyl-3-methyl-5-hydroxy-6-metoxy-1,4-benzoquinol methylase